MWQWFISVQRRLDGDARLHFRVVVANEFIEQLWSHSVVVSFTFDT